MTGFIDFVFSDEGQRIVEEVGFVSLWETMPSETPLDATENARE